MKTIYTLVVALFVLATAAQAQVSLPIDFESTTITYGFSDFDGGVATVIANPDASGINTSANVGSMVKNAGADFGGSTLALAGPIDFGTNNAFTMKVWSNAVGQRVLFKLEGTTAVEIFATTTVANQWEELTFSAVGATGLDFAAITIIYRLGEVGDGSADYTMYFDDIELTTAVATGVGVPVDFESTTLTYAFADFAGGVGAVIANPVPGGINTSANVARVEKFAGEVFAGSTLALGIPTDFGSNNGIKMKVFATRVDAPITFKLEGAVPTEEVARTTVANEWEEVTFNFSGRTAAAYTGITIIFDNGVMGDGSADFTIHFDDIEYTTISGPVVALPVDFENSNLTYSFGDFGGGLATVIDNPNATGVNTSNRVGSMVKNAGADFGGSTLLFGENIDFGTATAITMKTHANRVGAPVLLKLEGAVPVEVSMMTTVANAWEELTFDFTGLTGGTYTGVTIIYDLGVVGNGSADFTVYFDDIQVEGSVGTTDLSDLGVTFFPNPVSADLTIQSSTDVQSVEVFNINGQRVLSNAVMATNTVSTADLAAGTYILRVVTAEGVGTSTFVKR
ncbi:MAG: T9SS type A sorting domain-containing protein [Saprospiraceae bacterium]